MLCWYFRVECGSGSGGARIKTGRHVQCAEGTPLANLWLTQAASLGLVRDRNADSTGFIPEILAGVIVPGGSAAGLDRMCRINKITGLGGEVAGVANRSGGSES